MKVAIIPLYLAVITCATSAPITWDLPTDTTGKADLIEGAIVAALNGGSTQVVINDAGASGTSSYSFIPSNYTTINFTATGGDAGDVGRAGIGANQYAPSTITTTGDMSFDSLIASVAYAFGTPSGIVTGDMLLEGLTVGMDYQIQVFFNEQRSSGTPVSTDTRAMTYGDGLGNIVTIAGGDPAVEVQTDHYGQFAVGSFTADATTQVLTMDSSMGVTPFGNVHYNAILVTGPEDVNVAPQLADAAVELNNASPIGTLVATLVGTDGNAEDVLSYTITAGDPDNVFDLESDTGELTTAKEIDFTTKPLYNLTVEVSDSTDSITAAIDVTIVVPIGDSIITWQAAQNTSSVADLISGNPVFARNGGADAITIDGTEFESLNLGNGFSAAYGGDGILSTGDLDFDALVSVFSFGGGGGTSALPGNITGLTPGRTYTIQVFFNEQRPAQSSRIMSFGDGNGNFVDVAGGATLGTGESDDYGQFAIGQFTATSTTQILQLAPSGTGFGNSHYNAILVVEGGGDLSVPEITDISFDPATDEVSITWASNEGRNYALSYSTDLVAFDSDINDAIPADAGNTTTATFTLPAELVESNRVFFRVEAN